MRRMSFMRASPAVLGEQQERERESESEEIIARTQDGGGWPLSFLSLRRICVRVIIFLRPAMETRAYSREKRR